MMDLQTIIDGQMAKMKAEEFAGKPIRTLGEVILLLKMQPSKNIVQLDFAKATPRTLDSYRGYYEDLSIDYDEDAKPCSVATLLKWCEDADGRTFTGYKGGRLHYEP